jgi:NAD(P)H dehydrogenase (quinone)
MLWPINFTLAYVGYEVLAPFVAYGVEGGLRYSDQLTIDERLKNIAHDFRSLLTKLDQRKSVPFNRMSEWRADGRIMPDAPIYSPFVRRRENLELE